MGIFRRLPAGLGVRLGAEDGVDPAAWATMEPGTVAASRPPEAARNCLRSIGKFEGDETAGEGSTEELFGDALWSDEFLGHESWGKDAMRVTSANADSEN